MGKKNNIMKTKIPARRSVSKIYTLRGMVLCSLFHQKLMICGERRT